MAGALLQLVAYGAEDVYLTGGATITFFKGLYRRHTNFSIESIEQYMQGNLNFGTQTSVTISRSGDLVTKMILKLELPRVEYNGPYINNGHVQFAWVKNLGFAAVREYKLNIGGTDISTEYGDWLQIWSDLTLRDGLQPGLDRMIGNVPELTEISRLDWRDSKNVTLKDAATLYVPLRFYFTQNNNLALPLIALQYHEVKVNIALRNVNELYIASQAFNNGTQRLALTNASLFADYVFLDINERRRFASSTHEYLITVVQTSGDESANVNNGKYKMNFGHPVKAIYWVLKLGNYRGGRFMAYDPVDWERARETAARRLLLSQLDLNDFGYFNEVDGVDGDCYDNNNIRYCVFNPLADQLSFTFDPEIAERFNVDPNNGGALLGRLSADQPLLSRGGNGNGNGNNSNSYDLRDKVRGQIRISLDNDGLLYAEIEKITVNDLTITDLSIPVTKFDTDNRNTFIKNFDVNVWQHDNFGLLIDGSVNPITDVELQLNGSPRQSRRSGDWYDTVVPFNVHTRVPQKRGIGVFSFSIDPESGQPNGACNFSRIETAQLNLWFGRFNGPLSDVFLDSENKVYIYGRSYNILRMMSGMAGLAYN